MLHVESDLLAELRVGAQRHPDAAFAVVVTPVLLLALCVCWHCCCRDSSCGSGDDDDDDEEEDDDDDVDRHHRKARTGGGMQAPRLWPSRARQRPAQPHEQRSCLLPRAPHVAAPSFRPRPRKQRGSSDGQTAAAAASPSSVEGRGSVSCRQMHDEEGEEELQGASAPRASRREGFERQLRGLHDRLRNLEQQPPETEPEPEPEAEAAGAMRLGLARSREAALAATLAAQLERLAASSNARKQHIDAMWSESASA